MGPVINIPRIWLMHWVFALIADRRATLKQRMDSTMPSRDLGVVVARLDTTAYAAAYASTGSDLPFAHAQSAEKNNPKMDLARIAALDPAYGRQRG